MIVVYITLASYAAECKIISAEKLEIRMGIVSKKWQGIDEVVHNLI